MDKWFLGEFQQIRDDAVQEQAECRRRILRDERLLARVSQTNEKTYNRLLRKLYAEWARYYQLIDQIRDSEYHISVLEQRLHQDI